MLQFSEFVWMVSYSVWDVFNNLLLIDAADRSKISSDQKRFFIALSLYPLSFFANTPFKATAVCDRNQFGNVGSNKTYAYKILKYSDSVLTFLTAEEFTQRLMNLRIFYTIHFLNFYHICSSKIRSKSWKNDFLPTHATPLISLMNYSLKGCKILKNLSLTTNPWKREKENGRIIWEHYKGIIFGRNVTLWRGRYKKNKWLQ